GDGRGIGGGSDGASVAIHGADRCDVVEDPGEDLIAGYAGARPGPGGPVVEADLLIRGSARREHEPPGLHVEERHAVLVLARGLPQNARESVARIGIAEL